MRNVVREGFRSDRVLEVMCNREGARGFLSVFTFLFGRFSRNFSGGFNNNRVN
jgi:hypothetical protein